jgi:MFS family permease
MTSGSPPNPPDQAALRRARISVGSVFLIHAAVFGSWAPRVPAIKHHVGIGDGGLGIAFTGMAIGLFVGTRLAGRAVDRFGSRPAIRVAAPILCATLLGPALADDLPALTLALALMGVAGGFLDVAMNAQAVAVERGYGRPIMSSLHGLWSVGLMAGGIGAASAAAAGASPTVHFATVAVALLVASVVMLRGLLTAEAEALPAELDAPHTGVAPPLLAPAVVLLGLIAFSAFIGEGAAADWSAVYFHDNLHTSGALAAVPFIAFSVSMAASRFVSDRLSERFGPVAVVRAGGLVAAAGLGVGLAVHEPAAGVVAFALLGAGFAPVVPIAFSAAGNTGLGPTGVILGRVVTIAYIGSIVGPVVIGALAQAIGLRAALSLLPVLALVIAAVAENVSSAAGVTRVPTPAWPGAEPYTDADARRGL